MKGRRFHSKFGSYGWEIPRQHQRAVSYLRIRVWEDNISPWKKLVRIVLKVVTGTRKKSGKMSDRVGMVLLAGVPALDERG